MAYISILKPWTEFLWCSRQQQTMLRIGHGPESLVFIVIYAPPPKRGRRVSVDNLDSFETYLLRAFSTILHRAVILGDWNIHLDLPSPLRTRLYGLMDSLGAIQTVTEPTRLDRILDLAIIGDPERHISTSVDPPISSSDHRSISVELIGQPKKRTVSSKKVWLLKHADWASIKLRLLAMNLLHLVTSAPCVNSACGNITRAISSVIDEMVPSRWIRTDTRHPWINGDVLRLVRRKRAAYRRWRRERDSQLRDIYERGFKNLRREYRSAIKAAKRDYIMRSFPENQAPGQFWSSLRRLNPDDRTIPTLFDVFERPLATCGERATALNSAFASNFNESTSTPYFPPLVVDAPPNGLVTPAFVEREIRRLRNNIAPGDDGLTVPILKNISDSISPALASLFNRSIAEGCFPEPWKMAKVIAIAKPGGDKTRPSSYRPISLLSILSKILERKIDHLLRPLLDLSDHQHGFRRARGTNTALVIKSQQIHDWLHGMSGGFVTGVYLDLRKAFDQVLHPLLLRTLENYHRTPPYLLQWLSSYLSGRSQRVVVGDSSSASTAAISGVPQGSILGPTLFIAFIDPLLREFERRFPNLALFAYADDLCLLVPWKCVVAGERVTQEALDFIDDWIRSGGLDLNAAKTQAIVFRYRQGQLPVEPVVTLRGQRLAFAESVRYLGVIFSSDMRFSEHATSIAKSARSMIGAVTRQLGRHVHPNVLSTIYTSCIRSKLEYGAPAWDPINETDKASLERAQVFAMRHCLRDWMIDEIDGLRRLGWQKLENRRRQLKLIQLYKFYNDLQYFPFKFQLASEVKGRQMDRTTLPHQLYLPVDNRRSFDQNFISSAGSLWNGLDYNCAIAPFPVFRDFILSMNF